MASNPIHTLRSFIHCLTCIASVFYACFLPAHIASSIFLLGLGVRGSCPSEDVARYKEFKEKHKAAVIVFNHPTFFDHAVLMHSLEDRLRFVMTDKYHVGIVKIFAKQMRVISISSPGSGNARRISDAIMTRSSGEDLVTISPNAGDVSPTSAACLPDFRTGAFITKSPVLPIVICYQSYRPWLSGVPLMKHIKEHFCRFEPFEFEVRVLAPLYAKVHETPGEYAQRCRLAMESALEPEYKDTIPLYSASSDEDLACFWTSHLFLVSAVVTWFVKDQRCFAAGMLVTYGTSLVYWATKSSYWRKLDMIVNWTMAISFGFYLLVHTRVIPLFFLLMATVGFTFNLNHALCVHLPIAIGFLSI
jgi:1-acyl-sn-glycerol-3-phosphate acyltransferase